MSGRWLSSPVGGMRPHSTLVGAYLGCVALLLAIAGLALDQSAGSAMLAVDAALEANDFLSARHEPITGGPITGGPTAGRLANAEPANGRLDIAPLQAPSTNHDGGIVALVSIARSTRAASPGVALASTGERERGLSQPIAKVERETANAWYAGDGLTFQTMCVRLCDGFYWPMSFSTTADNFEHDEGACQKSCGAPTRLFHFTNPGGTPETMEDANGRAYSRLKAAFLFQTRREATCTCKPEPWSIEANASRRVMALQAQLAKQRQAKSRSSGPMAAAEIATLQKELADLQAQASATSVKVTQRPAGDAVWREGPLTEALTRKQATVRPQPIKGDGFMGLGAGAAAPIGLKSQPRALPPQPPVQAVGQSSRSADWQKRVFDVSR